MFLVFTHFIDGYKRTIIDSAMNVLSIVQDVLPRPPFIPIVANNLCFDSIHFLMLLLN